MGVSGKWGRKPHLNARLAHLWLTLTDQKDTYDPKVLHQLVVQNLPSSDSRTALHCFPFSGQWLAGLAPQGAALNGPNVQQHVPEQRGASVQSRPTARHH